MITGIITKTRKFQFFGEIKDDNIPSEEININKIIEQKEREAQTPFLSKIYINISFIMPKKRNTSYGSINFCLWLSLE